MGSFSLCGVPCLQPLPVVSFINRHPYFDAVRSISFSPFCLVLLGPLGVESFFPWKHRYLLLLSLIVFIIATFTSEALIHLESTFGKA